MFAYVLGKQGIWLLPSIAMPQYLTNLALLSVVLNFLAIPISFIPHECLGIGPLKEEGINHLENGTACNCLRRVKKEANKYLKEDPPPRPLK